ncbi:hypothetical protein ACIRVK_41205 [Streptomyces sp. NPDC101152]|uniref:hypothetical protein n=1 Tax=Streptomyces sp. NPDC101152 TaxID=3366116 RepID=UPI00382E4185
MLNNALASDNPWAKPVSPPMFMTDAARPRNLLFSLNGELADAGIYAGTLSIAAFIARSEVGELAAKSLAETGSTNTGPLVDPDALADQYWDMYTKRDRVEQLFPEYDAA